MKKATEFDRASLHRKLCHGPYLPSPTYFRLYNGFNIFTKKLFISRHLTFRTLFWRKPPILWSPSKMPIILLVQSSARIRLIFVGLFLTNETYFSMSLKNWIIQDMPLLGKNVKKYAFPESYFRKPLQWLLAIRKLQLWQPFAFSFPYSE